MREYLAKEIVGMSPFSAWFRAVDIAGILAKYEVLTQERDKAKRYAGHLFSVMLEKYYPNNTTTKPSADLLTLLTQIDNATTGWDKTIKERDALKEEVAELKESESRYYAQRQADCKAWYAEGKITGRAETAERCTQIISNTPYAPEATARDHTDDICDAIRAEYGL